MWLISFGANVNAQNSSLETPLHTLLKSIEPLCDTKVVKELIFRGVQKDLLNRDGKSALEVYKEANEIRLL
jgi:ankyrin repeat protein